MTRTMYAIKSRDYTNDTVRITEYHQHERSAIREVKRLNAIQIDRLTAEIASLNGAIRGKGVERMHQIREMLKNPKYFIEPIRVQDGY